MELGISKSMDISYDIQSRSSMMVQSIYLLDN